MQCEMLCSRPPPHSSLTHAHSSRGQVSSSATAKASANRGRGGGGGGGGAPPEQDGQRVDEYQGPHEGVCVCVHVCVSKWRTQSRKSEEGPRESGYLRANSAHQVDTCPIWYVDSIGCPA